VKAAGENEGFDSGFEEGWKLTSSLGKAGTSSALDEAIYNLKEGEISKTPIKVEGKWVIVGVVKRREPDFTAFNGGERDRLKQQLLGTRQNQVFEDYIAGVQQRMTQDGKIKIYDAVLASLDESEAAAEPALPAGLNFPTK
jgi:parvulin-like peptidyl-prolyl isomerase